MNPTGMNPIGSKERRDELRHPDARDWPTLRANWDKALDGLDIAEVVMRAEAVLQYPTVVGAAWYTPWEKAAWNALDEALRQWNAWEEQS